MLVDKLKNSILDAAFKGKLNTNDLSELRENYQECSDKPYNIPANWIFSKMKDIEIPVDCVPQELLEYLVSNNIQLKK